MAADLLARKETAFIAHIRLLDQGKAGRRQAVQDAVPISGALAARATGAISGWLADLEIDVLGKALDETHH